MKSESQFNAYAAFYDLLYKDKDYGAEAKYIDQVITRFFKRPKKKIHLLDLACGTGRHLQELYEKGYGRLCGSDISTPMIELARKSAKRKKLDLTFYNHSFQDAHHISEKFDIVISMFSAVDYITTYEDQSKTLSNIHNLLQDGGLFIFDFWNGNAVTTSYSPVKVLRKKNRNEEILRISETKIDPIEQSVEVKFTCSFFKDSQKMLEFEELHHLHYYYLPEIRNLLASHHFEVLHVAPFMHLNKTMEPSDWNISIIARKIPKV